MRYGYNGVLLFADLSSKRIWTEQRNSKWYRLLAGGGLMGTALLMQHTTPGLDPLSKDMMLIFASSVIAGQDAPGLARFCVVAKSPLSGGIAEARGEGGFGMSMKRSGYDAICIVGQSENPVSIVIDEGTPRIEDASFLWGKNTLETAQYYQKKYGAQLYDTAAIGIAGERLVRYADIVVGGANHAARLGTGAVMGAKKLKALVIKGGTCPCVADESALKRVCEYFDAQMPLNTLSMWQKNPPGFSASADLSDYDTAYIGANNYLNGLYSENTAFKREKYMPYYRGENPCPCCPNNCMKYIGRSEDPVNECCIHQEITGSFGANLGNSSLEIMLEANRLCNLNGIDPVSLGFSISFAMECRQSGLLSERDCDGLDLGFGLEEAIIPLAQKICRREGLGALLGEGVKRAAEKIGKNAARFAMHVKGVEMVNFEPRSQTNLAMGYAFAPIGPRYDICEHDWDFDTISGWPHTMELSNAIGILERIPMQEQSLRKVKNFNALYDLWSACDALNLCIFACAPTRVLNLEKIAQMIAAVTGFKTSSYEFMRYGRRRNTIMRLYNIREGFSEKDDLLPERFYSDPISFGRLKGTCLEKTKFKEAIKLYYGMCGWDEHGVPLKSTLYDLELEEFLA